MLASSAPADDLQLVMRASQGPMPVWEPAGGPGCAQVRGQRIRWWA